MPRSIRPTLALALAAALLGAHAAPALAQETIAPRGNSGVEQYFEVVPGPGGDQRPGAGAGAGGGEGGGEPVLSPEQERLLAAQGPAGRDLAQVVNAQSAAPAKPKRKPGAREKRSGAARAGGDDSAPGSTLGDALAAGSQEGGMGVALPLLLLASAAAIGVLALLRRRRA